MTLDDLKKWLVPIAATFGGGALTAAITQMEDHVPQTPMQWKTIGIGALVAGLAALLPSPAFPAKPPPEPEQRL